MADLEGLSGFKVENIKVQVDRVVFPDSHGFLLLASGRLLIGGRVMIAELVPFCALLACVEGFQVATLEEVVG
eukprot:1680341-Karenia_brevis.AAC.1